MSNIVNERIMSNIIEIVGNIIEVEKKHIDFCIDLAQQEENIHIFFNKESDAPLFECLKEAKKMVAHMVEHNWKSEGKK